MNEVDPRKFAEVACQFMARADLKGAEVPVYTEVFNLMQAIGMREFVLVPQAQHEKFLELERRAVARAERRKKSKNGDKS